MYATLDDLKKKLSDDELLRLTDDQDLDVIDEAIVNAAIEAAGVEVDSYLGERYSLPLNPVPGIVSKIAQDIAVYNLYARNHEGPTEHWEKRYLNAIKLLDRIAEGQVTLGATDPDSGESELPKIDSSGRVFSRDSMKGW
jgi:phage gp36-like protein